METKFPDESFEKELIELTKKQKRLMRFSQITDILLIIVGIGLAILVWNRVNLEMADRAYNDGFEQGYEQAHWEMEDVKWTDGYIWEKYHDCDMYGLPSYAEPYCKKASK